MNALYDAACKKFHGCISCGYHSDIPDIDENVNINFNMEVAVGSNASFSISTDLSTIIPKYNLPYDYPTSTIYIYNWECVTDTLESSEMAQSEAAMAVCKAFKQLEDDFYGIFLRE